ncbi:hypothetical protein KNE206_04590 [Kitasatospora sp. NE20-6]|uniref:hypothetical protein n=1 Tax=Kitasatospora sp. NE20-6 TaxID=2859066 RepID=UPI0034DBCF17
MSTCLPSAHGGTPAGPALPQQPPGPDRSPDHGRAHTPPPPGAGHLPEPGHAPAHPPAHVPGHTPAHTPTRPPGPDSSSGLGRPLGPVTPPGTPQRPGPARHPEAHLPHGPQQTQSWASSAAEQASDVLSGLRTVEVPLAALQAALLILTELVARPHETTGMREAAREICGVFAGLTDHTA